MSLSKGTWASADGPYIRANGAEVKVLKYKEIVEILVEQQADGEVYVEGLDSKERTWILASSLTPVDGTVLKGLWEK